MLVTVMTRPQCRSCRKKRIDLMSPDGSGLCLECFRLRLNDAVSAVQAALALPESAVPAGDLKTARDLLAQAADVAHHLGNTANCMLDFAKHGHRNMPDTRTESN